MDSNQNAPQPAPQPPSLGDRLRQDLAIVERRREDATQLHNALTITAQLADEVDRLTMENAALHQYIAQNLPAAPADPDAPSEPDLPDE